MMLPMFFLAVGLNAQNLNIKGKVIDSDGNALAGAAVRIQETAIGTATNDDGDYVLNNVPRGSVLEFILVGFVTQEIKVTGDKTVISAILIEESQSLDEVTVVAFSRQKKESVIGSIATVSAKELKVPSSNLTTAFAGKVAGMISYQTSGEPGQDNAQFFIRGITTFGAAAKKDPLILIDGVELTTDDLARLNTDDIESFSVMKDATSTALYGARGANGVILVNTKEGREGRIKVNVRLENSFSSPTEMIKVTDPVTYMRMHNESIITRDPDGILEYPIEKIEMTERGTHPDIYPATDWYNTMFDKVISNQRANLSISGGGSVARYYVAVNIAQDNGNMKVDKRNSFNNNINLTKYAIRTNVNVNLTKTTELIFKLSSTFDEYDGPIDGGSGMYSKVIQANPVLFKPYYEPDEEYSYAKHILFGNYSTANYINPYAEVMKGYRDYSTNTTSTQFGIDQNLNMLTEGLSVRAMVNMNRYSDFSVTRAYRPYFYNLDTYDLVENTYTLRRLNTNGDDKLGYAPGDRTINTSFYLEATAEYNRQFAQKHNVGGLLVYIMRQEKQGVAENLLLSLPHRNLGLSGRATYNYDSRYFLEFNFGYNGSERFSKKHRWGFFPSVGLAWMLSNEKFFEPLKDVFSTVKFKGTYGMVGNDQIGSSAERFYYLSNVNTGAGKNPMWGPVLRYNPGGMDVTQYANENIGWETAYKTNIGIEIAMKNGLSLIADVFHERRENILIDRVMPGTMGILPSVKANLGVGSGQGFDIELNYEKSFTKDLFLTGRGTFTYATNEVVEWEEPDYSATPWKSNVGYNIYQTKGYIAERLFVDEREVDNSPEQFGRVMAGDIKYRDINGDGKISALDEVPIGYPTVPEITYGFGLTAGYKGFDASFFFQGSARRSFWFTLEGNGRIQPFLDGNGDDGLIGQNAILQAIADNYWNESNRDPYAFWPRLANYEIENNNKTSTWYMHDASFLRLKSAEIGYTLPQHLTKKFFVSNLRVYVSGTNLLRWSGFKLWDPELGGNGLGYPLQRVFSVGINIGL
ncbi:MAG: TonB-dependent receptor [Prevotellaceae bacterium]|jgi:TonB-linked SusC/RagA family outer membrane protein|nr:TonB-dependent receptor [Prevotellaceae bacterium]